MKTLANTQIILTVQFSPWSAYSGGAQQSTHNIAVHLSKKGLDVKVIYTKPWFDKITTPTDLPYQIIWATYPGKITKGRGFWRNLTPISVLWNASLLLLKKRRTIVHSNSEEGAFLGILRPFITKLICTVRYPSFPPLIAKRKKTLYDFGDIAINHLRYYLQGMAARFANEITTPSLWAKDTITDVFELKSEKIKVINNGVPTEFLNFERNHVQAQNGPIVFFGRITAEKGVDLVIRAYSRLINPVNKLVIIGDGAEIENMKMLATDLGLDNNCSFLGWKNHDELAEILCTAKMACLPSHYENFSLAILSAMCVGLPVIATKVGGNAEIISSPEVSMLIQEPDELQLTQAIQILLDEKLNISMGQKANNHIRENFTWDSSAGKLLGIYQLKL